MKIVEKTPERRNEGDEDWSDIPTLNIEDTIPLKYLSNF